VKERREAAIETMTGVVIVVQEGRFRVAGDDGIPRQFVLSHKARLEPQDLAPLQREQAHVCVRYAPSRSLIAGIAHDLVILDRPAPARSGRGFPGAAQ
jgi:hypothetical protein